MGAFNLREVVSFRRERTDSAPADFDFEQDVSAKAMKAKRPGAERPPCGLWRFWNSLVLCCCGERESLHKEALVVVPVSELSRHFIDYFPLFGFIFTT